MILCHLSAALHAMHGPDPLPCRTHDHRIMCNQRRNVAGARLSTLAVLCSQLASRHTAFQSTCTSSLSCVHVKHKAHKCTYKNHSQRSNHKSPSAVCASSSPAALAEFRARFSQGLGPSTNVSTISSDDAVYISVHHYRRTGQLHAFTGALDSACAGNQGDDR